MISKFSVKNGFFLIALHFLQLVKKKWIIINQLQSSKTTSTGGVVARALDFHMEGPGFKTR